MLQIESDVFKKRIVIALFIIIIMVIILIANIYKLQVIEYKKYSKQAINNIISLTSIVPNRGRIFDRNGEVLANNKLAYKLVIMLSKIKNLSAALKTLKKYNFITQADIVNFLKKKRYSNKFKNIILKKKLTEDNVARFLATNNLAGVYVLPYFYRFYHHSFATAHIIGYVGIMNDIDKKIYNNKKYNGTEFIGKTGIERSYERLLHGLKGIKQVEKNAFGRIIDEKIIKEPLSGKDIYLTIDIKLQQKALNVIKNRRGSIVVLDVNSGEILAMVSSPSFDANLFVNGISQTDYSILKNNANLPLFNRSIKGTYPPGSTIKPMIALVGLENGIIDRHTNKFCVGYYKLKNYSRRFNGWKKTGHGHVDVTDAIAQSCDVFFYDLANNMGIDMLYNGLKHFRFGEKTGVNLPGEKAGVLPSKAWKKIYKKEPWYKGETLITGIGQGFITVTPLQLALATAAIANFGNIFIPTIVQNNNRRKIIKTVPIKNIKNWDLIINGMKKTIYDAKGTARRLNRRLKYTLAGKTGTAQVFGLDPHEQYVAEKYPEKLRDHALFIAFAPIEKPEVAISVILENAGSGSSKAAPIAKKILNFYFNNK